LNDRYLCGFTADSQLDPAYDVLIIGSGIAGLYTALNLSSEKRILLLTKNTVTECNSNLAQGGIAAAMTEDDYQLHMLDTMEAGNYHNLPEAVQVIVQESRENILRLIELGVFFDRNETGELICTREGGHSKSRILHAKDATGKEIMRALSDLALRTENIKVMEYTQAIDLITDTKGCRGAVIWHQDAIRTVFAGHVVLATGGIGQLYQHTTNSLIASGDGIAMAYRAGAQISDMEFIQFHPTALYSPNYDRNFLISEAVRGEGGILRNESGVAFMEDVHPRKDLAPRDVVAREILQQMQLSGKPFVYLDVTHLDGEYIQERFPNIFERCLLEGIDITKEYIPICPVEHYLMGGVVADLSGATSLPNLYACGEVSKTGTHGANRLASNSLLEAIVFGRRIARHINAVPLQNADPFKLEIRRPLDVQDCGDCTDWVHSIQSIMTDYVWIFRNLKELKEASGELNKLVPQMTDANVVGPEYFRARNMLNVAQLVVDAAMKRHESLGSHVIEVE